MDLWKPELAGRVAMVDSPREVVGAVLKSLGASYNTRDFDTEIPGGREAVKERFLTLQKQVFYLETRFHSTIPYFFLFFLS